MTSSANPDSLRRWWVLIGLMLIYAVTNGIVVMTLPLLYPELIDEFGWSAAQVTLPATAFFVFGAVSSPPAGYLLDRFSPRLLMFIGSLLMIAMLVACTLVTELWQLVVCFVAFGLSLSLCGLTSSMVVLTRWFSKDRGRATGLLLMSSSIGGALFPQLLGAGIEEAGWRVGLQRLTLVAALVILPALAFCVRDRRVSGRDGQPSPNTARRIGGPTLAQALRSPSFYVIALATASVWFCVVGLLQNQAIYFAKEVGLPRNQIPGLFSVFFMSAVVGKLGFGWLGDYLDKEITMALSIAAFLAGIAVLTQVAATDASLLMVYAVVTGLGFSGAFTTIQLLIAEYFAGASYGVILALLVMIDSLAGGLGSRVTGLIYDRTGSYMMSFQLMLGLCSLAICAVLLVRRWRLNVTGKVETVR